MGKVWKVGRVLMILLLMLVIGKYCSAQEMQISKIKSSDSYYWGEKCSQNMNEARDKALSQLISGIAVYVSSSFENKIVEETSNEDSNIEEKTTGVLQTYSAAALNNVENIQYPAGDCGINVFLYIAKSEVRKIFEERKQIVRDVYRKALIQEEDQNYAYALKLYYFSIILLNSIPDQSLYLGAKNLYLEIPERINGIIQNVSFGVTRDELVDENTREIELVAKVNDKIAHTLDFTFWDGSNQVSAQSRDGRATVELYGSSTAFSKLDINIKYSYYEKRNEIKEVGNLWDLVSKPNFTGISKSVDIGEPDKKEERSKRNYAVNVTDTNTLSESLDVQELFSGMNSKDENIESTDQKTEKTIETSLEKGQADDPEIVIPTDEIQQQSTRLYGLFNTDPFVLPADWQEDEFLDMKLNRLERYNNIKVLQTESGATINETYDGLELRQLPALVKYKTLNMQSNEYLIPDFDTDGNLTDVNFGILEGLYKKFQEAASYGKDWKERQVIIKFMERYRTAYMTRDLDQVEKMFADEAIIIVGRVIKKEATAAEKYKYEKAGSAQPDVSYLRYTKEEYLETQKQLFKTKPDIFLGFSSFDILKKTGQKGIYGISLRQSYSSTNYADEGYLFLLVDFNEEEPKIYVRAWQPQQWSDSSLIDMANFNVNF